MAKLWITEFGRSGLAGDTETLGRSSGLDPDVPVATEPAVADQVVDFTAGETDSAAFNAATRIVRLYADTDCHIIFHATAPVATTSKQPLAARTEAWRSVPAGYKVSVIAAA